MHGVRCVVCHNSYRPEALCALLNIAPSAAGDAFVCDHIALLNALQLLLLLLQRCVIGILRIGAHVAEAERDEQFERKPECRSV